MFALIPPTADTDTLLCIVDTLLQVQCAYNTFALIPPAADRDTTQTSVRSHIGKASSRGELICADSLRLFKCIYTKGSLHKIQVKDAGWGEGRTYHYTG